MALNAAIVFEVRTTGSDTNGGGFKTGASGTDWSQQTSAQYSVTDGVTAGTTTITSATASFGTDVVGNLIYVQGGTGSVAADWYEITARTNATTITVDRSTGLTAGTGVTLKIGGALLTIQKALDLMTVAGHTTYIKSGTYSISAALTTTNFPASNYATINRVVGYNTTRGDLGSGGRPVIQTTAAVNGLTSTKDGLGLENLDFFGNTTGTKGISIGGSYHCYAYNCLFRNFTSNGADITAGTARQCESKNNGGTGIILAVSSGSAQAQFCYVHDNTSYGISIGVGCCAVSCISSTNSYGFYSNYGACLYGCVAYNNTNAGFYAQTYAMHGIITNCIFVNNGTYGINLSGTTAVRDDMRLAYNAYYNNTSGARNNGNAGIGDVTLTGSPFTNAASGDFSLNNTAGAGAACRAAGFPGAYPAGLTTGYLDIGAAQHQDSGGGGGAATLINGGLVG